LGEGRGCAERDCQGNDPKRVHCHIFSSCTLRAVEGVTVQKGLGQRLRAQARLPTLVRWKAHVHSGRRPLVWLSHCPAGLLFPMGSALNRPA
jgi:hypothetical protein